MKIISSYKDYYDYLTGVYGVDDKIILDRRDKCSMKQLFSIMKFSPYTILKLKIGEKYYDGLYISKDNQFYWGKELLNFGEAKSFNQVMTFSHSYSLTKHNIIHCPLDKTLGYVKLKKEYDDNPHYIRYLCMDPYINKSIIPNKKTIVLFRDEIQELGYGYPELSQLSFSKLLSPEKIYLELTNFLSPKDPVPNKMTDKEKIISKGFDIKKSFRNIK